MKRFISIGVMIAYVFSFILYQNVVCAKTSHKVVVFNEKTVHIAYNHPNKYKGDLVDLTIGIFMPIHLKGHQGSYTAILNPGAPLGSDEIVIVSNLTHHMFRLGNRVKIRGKIFGTVNLKAKDNYLTYMLIIVK